MEEHTAIIQNRCRICGVRFYKSDKKHSKLKYAKEILELFGISVETESDEIFPNMICPTEAALLYRFKTSGDRSVFDRRQISLMEFPPHNDSCTFCCRQPLKKGPGKKVKNDLRWKRRKIDSPEHHFDHDQNDSSVDLLQSNQDKQKPTSPNTEHEELPLVGSILNDTPEGNNKEQDFMKPDQLLYHFGETLKNSNSDEKASLFTNIISLLEESDCCLLMKCLGQILRSQVIIDAESFFYFYKDIQSMQTFSTYLWLQERSKLMTSLILGLGNSVHSDLQTNSDLLLVVSRAIEQLYSVCCPTLISPMSFLLNISAYAVTGSKLIVDMIGKANPAGQYKAVTNWIKDLSQNATHCPDGDLVNIFDNEQVIGKSYAIKPKNKVSVSIITNKGFVELQTPECLQHKPELKPTPISVLQMSEGTDTSTETENKDKPSNTLELLPEDERNDMNDESIHTAKLNIYDHDCEGTGNKESVLKAVISDIIEQSSQQYQDYEKDHYTQLSHFIDHAIERVVAEQTFKNGHYEDTIDSALKLEKEKAAFIKCLTCGTLNTKRKRICITCNEKEGLQQAREREKNEEHKSTDKPTFHKVIFHDEKVKTEVYHEATQFSHIPSHHKGKHELVLTDPVFCNPNSIIAVARVLRQIGVENGIARYGGTKRYWTFVCVDGLPYMIIKKLKEEAVICAVEDCSASFLNQKEYKIHAENHHPNQELKYVQEFDWMYLIIGAGHYEMNLIKSFFELNWVPFLESMCEQMGFQSDAAKNFAKTCKDHHKSWRLLLVFHLGALQEMVLPYVRHCLLTDEHPFAKGFLDYISQTYSSDSFPNFHYMVDQVCRFSQGIINFRMSVRRNNSHLYNSAKYMTKELFFGRNHPNYQTIEMFDNIQRNTMPEEVRNVLDSYVSITTSGNDSLGEGFDFILEEKNKELKSWLPKGLPTESVWQTVCRNNKALDNIKVNGLETFGLHLEKGKYIRALEIESSIEAFRMNLRRNEYLTKGGNHTSLSGVALDEKLVDFIQQATQRRIYRLKTDFLGLLIDLEPSDKQPVPITVSDREKSKDINKLNLKQLHQKIEEMLQGIEEPFQNDFHRQLYNDVKKKKKSELVSFLEDLRQMRSALSSEYEDRTIMTD